MSSTEVRAPSSMEGAASVEGFPAAVTSRAQSFTKPAAWPGFSPDWLRLLGVATASSHIRIFANDDSPPPDRLSGTLLAEWRAPDTPTDTLGDSFHVDASELWVRKLSAGGVVVGLSSELSGSEQPLLELPGCAMAAIVPIVVNAQWWGFIAFSDRARAHQRSPAEIEGLLAAAEMYNGVALPAIEARIEATGKLAPFVQNSRAASQLELTASRYRRLVEATLEGVLIHDGQRILDSNPSLAAMVGLTVEQIIGRNPFDFIHPDYVPIVRRNFHSGYALPYVASLLRADGTDFPIEMQGRDFVQDGARLRVTSIRDLTERKAAELAAQKLQDEHKAHEQSERNRARAEFLDDATRILSSSFDTTTTMDQLAHLCVRFLGTCCAVSLYDRGDEGYVAFVHGPEQHESHSRRTIVEWKATTDENEILRTRQRRGEAFVIDSADAAQVREHAVVLEALGAHVLLSVPIGGAGAVLGSILFIGGPDRTAFDAEERAGAEELGRRAAVALQLAKSYHDAVAATAARDEILAVVAHDLRNPLSTIRMGSSLALELMSPAPETPGRRQLEIIVRTTERMNRLIQDLLDATRLQSGRLALELVPLLPGTLIDEALEMLLPLASHAGITLEAGAVTAVNVIHVDRLRLQQVLSNLIGNALKFTPSGGSVRVSAEQAERAVCFRVTDSGHGIAADQLPHVFGRFWQARRTDRRGLGLGLAIARGIVEAHGGTISVDSVPGAGSTFKFTIPTVA